MYTPKGFMYCAIVIFVSFCEIEESVLQWISSFNGRKEETNIYNVHTLVFLLVVNNHWPSNKYICKKKHDIYVKTHYNKSTRNQSMIKYYIYNFLLGFYFTHAYSIFGI